MTLGESRLSVHALLYINLGIGLLVTLANGAALVITLSGKAAQLVGKEPEIILWLSLGVMLVVASLLGIVRRREKTTILRLQTLIIALLATLLAGWGLTLVFGNLPESRTIWTFGYLTGVAIYAVYLASRSFGDAEFRTQLFFARVFFLPIFIIIDLLVFLRVGGN